MPAVRTPEVGVAAEPSETERDVSCVVRYPTLKNAPQVLSVVCVCNTKQHTDVMKRRPLSTDVLGMLSFLFTALHGKPKRLYCESFWLRWQLTWQVVPALTNTSSSLIRSVLLMFI